MRTLARTRKRPGSLTAGLVGMRWSNPATWGGTLPTAGDVVVVPAGQTIILDVPGALALSVEVQGTLRADPALDVGLTAGHVVVGSTGVLEIGTEAAPYTRKATLTFDGGEAGRAIRYVTYLVGSSGAGNGKLAGYFTSGATAEETITVTFSSATAFTVSGSVSGALGAGTVGTLFNNKVRFTATAGGTPWANGHTVTLGLKRMGFTNNGVGRSLQVEPGGKLSLIGVPPAFTRTKLNAHAANGNTAFTLADAVGWAPSDEIVIGPSDWYGTGPGASQKLTVASVAGTTLNTTTGISSSRWGLLQYATNAGMSLTPGTFTKPHADVPEVLDERAPVINLTRNIVLQGANDSAWASTGFGFHGMAMGQASEVRLNGVEIRRCGQGGALGRYPWHEHMPSFGGQPGGNLSLPSDGTFLGALDPTKRYIKNCSIHSSSNRALTIHGAHGFVADGNVIFDIKGHAVMLEEGPEMGNTITNNVVLKVRLPATFGQFDEFFNLTMGEDRDIRIVTGIWLSNPNNTVTGNTTADCYGPGWWNVAQMANFGLCVDVPGTPVHQRVGNINGNTSHSNFDVGFNNVGRVTDARVVGTGISPWEPRDNDGPSGNLVVDFELADQRIWKNQGGYNNRVSVPRYKRWLQADNGGRDFFGTTNPAFVSFAEHILGVGLSLNQVTPYAYVRSNAQGREYPWAAARSHFATYHGTLAERDSVVINYPYENAALDPTNTIYTGAVGNNEVGGGVFGRDDLYISPVDNSLAFTSNVVRINCATNDYTSKNVNTAGGWARNGNVTFADCIIDAATGPAGKPYWIKNELFLTSGIGDLVDAQSAADNNGKWTATKFMGVLDLLPDWWALVASSIYQPIGSTVIDRLQSDGSTIIATKQWPLKGDSSGYLGSWRHWAFASGGIYRVTFAALYANGPYGPPLTSLSTTIHFLSDSAHSVTLGLPWGGASLPATKRYTTIGGNTGNNGRREFAGVANFAAVRDGTAGTECWLDTTNKTLWLKLKGGLNTQLVPNRYDDIQLELVA